MAGKEVIEKFGALRLQKRLGMTRGVRIGQDVQDLKDRQETTQNIVNNPDASCAKPARNDQTG